MSQFGMTPISILDKSPMGGFRGGMADTRSLMHSDSALASEDLLRQKTQDELETSKLNRPVDAAKRALELAKAENEQRDIASGEFNKARETERNIRMQELLDKTNEVQRKQILQKAEDSVAVSSVFAPDDTDETRAQKWTIAKQIADQRGIKGFPETYSIEAWQKLQAQSQAAPSMIKMIQEKDMKTFQSGLDTNKELITTGARANYDLARQNDQQEHTAEQNRLARANNLAVAKVRVESDNNKPMTKSETEAAAYNKVKDYLDGKQGATKPSELDIAMATKMAFGTQIEKLVDDKVQNDPEIKAREKAKADQIQLSQYGSESQRKVANKRIAELDKEIQARKEQVAANIEERLPGYTGFKKAIKERTGITVPPGATVRKIENLPGGPVSEAPTPTTTKPITKGPPAVGTIEGGYKFKGGDPKNKANWEKV
jgi:hypothetical protein